ncbi:MAG: autotransporter-associated beta strand repeat-containing protein [Kiritimatiellae bacterium]|nr:autotransporter-associated beta strand repeat-containing protein [Kiritimatiellia bacterium]
MAGGSFVATNGVPFRIGNHGAGNAVGFVTNSGGTMRLTDANVLRGLWVINGGTVLLSSTLWLTNSTGSVQFTAGLVSAGAVAASNGTALTVGDGASTAVLGLGGTSTFADGLVLNPLSALVVSNAIGATPHRLFGNISGSGGLLKLGSGWMILEGANTYSGGTTAQVGILEAVSPGALPGYNTAGKVLAAAGAVLAVMGGGTGQWTAPDVDTLLANMDAAAGSFLGFDIPSNSFTYGTAIAGSRGLVKLGSGVLTLSGSSSYTFPTFVRNGTLQLGAANALPTTGDLVLGSTNVLLEGGTLDMNGLSQRAARLFAATVTNAGAGATNRVIGLSPGQELSIVSGAADRFVQVQIGAHMELSGGGRLALTNTSGTVMIWGQASTDMINFRGMDAAQLGELHADVGSIVVGFDPTAGETQQSRQAVLLLANTNTIRAATLTVAQSPRDGSIRGRMFLGVSNRLNVSTLRLGYDKGTGWLLFRDGFTAPSVWISGRNPGERVNISQGEFLSLNSGTQPHGYLLATNDGASVNIYADQWVLGTLGTNAGSATAGGRGTTIIRDGAVDVNTLIIGRSFPTVSTGSGLGWFTLLGGTMTVNSGIVLGQMLGGGSDIAGTLILSGGVTTVSGNIADGGGTSTLMLDGGTLNMQGNAIGSAGNPINNLTLARGVLRNVGQINGGANWAKTGSGTLTMEGTHSYSGALTVQSGTLLYNGTYTGSGLITVQNTAVLGGTGSVAGIYVASGGTLAPGASPGVLTASGNVTFEPGSVFEVEVLGTLAGQYDQLLMNASSSLTPGGATLSVIAPSPLPYGAVFPIISGWGSIDSSTFAGLADGNTFVAGANTFQINYGTLSGYNDDVTLLVIPEPSTLGLLGVVSVAVLLRRRLRG